MCVGVCVSVCVCVCVCVRVCVRMRVGTHVSVGVRAGGPVGLHAFARVRLWDHIEVHAALSCCLELGCFI